MSGIWNFLESVESMGDQGLFADQLDAVAFVLIDVKNRAAVALAVLVRLGVNFSIALDEAEAPNLPFPLDELGKERFALELLEVLQAGPKV